RRRHRIGVRSTAASPQSPGGHAANRASYPAAGARIPSRPGAGVSYRMPSPRPTSFAKDHVLCRSSGFDGAVRTGDPETYRLVVGRYREQVLRIVNGYDGHIGSTKGDG